MSKNNTKDIEEKINNIKEEKKSLIEEKKNK